MKLPLAAHSTENGAVGGCVGVLEPNDAAQTGGTVRGGLRNSSWEVQTQAGKGRQSIAGERRPCRVSGFPGYSSAECSYRTVRESLKVGNMNLDSSSPEMRIWFVVRTLVYENLQCLFVNKFVVWVLSDGCHLVQMCLNNRFRIERSSYCTPLLNNNCCCPR